jgi:hypothetical protein
MERYDPNQLRISDSDRHQVAELLRQAAGEGRIDFDELDERLEAAYAAKTYADLVPITADLPTRATGSGPLPQPRPATTPPVPAATYSNSISVMGDCTRRGVWQVGERHTAFSMMGSVTLDLREAQFAAPEVTIDAYAIMAGIDVIVNAHTQVIVEGVGIMGDFSESRPKVPAEITPTSQVVRVKGMALMAGVSVQRKPMPGESRKRLGRKQ